MDSDPSLDPHDTPAPDAPMAPPSPPSEMAAPFVPEPPAAPAAPAAPSYAPTEQVPQYAPTAQYTPAAAAPSSVVLQQSAAPAKRKPFLGIAAGVAILGLGAAAVVGWMGKASAEDDVKKSEAVAASLSAEADDLQGQLDTANQAAADATAELDGANGQISELEGQIGDLEGQIGDLETQIAEKDAEIATLEDTLDGGGDVSEPQFNDLVLTSQEYDVVKSVTPIPPPPIEQARLLGADVCAAETLPAVLDAVTSHQGDFPAGTALDDMAKVAGAIAGLMCVEHLQELAG